MTVVQCTKRHCLNNKRGRCMANDICIDNRCKSYAAPAQMMRANAGARSRVRREHGKYKNKDYFILK